MSAWKRRKVEDRRLPVNSVLRDRFLFGAAILQYMHGENRQDAEEKARNMCRKILNETIDDERTEQ